jgi:tetratricopeptide (TPR) repeat protein
VPLARYDEVLAIMREAEALAMRLDDRARLGRVLADICARLRNVAGEHHQAIEVGRRALAIAKEIQDRDLEHEAQYRTGQAYFAVGDYRPALELLSRCTETARDERYTSELFVSWSHAWLALTLSSLGRFVEAMAHAQAALRIAQASDHPFSVAEALTATGSVLLEQGELDPAIEWLERARVLIREWHLRSWAASARLGYAYARSARCREARDLLEQVAQQSTTMSSLGVGRAVQLAWLGETYLREGRLDAALEHAERALSMARRHSERAHEAWSLRLLGVITAQEVADVERAERYFRDALALGDELGMRPLAAHCHADLGLILQRSGRHVEASHHLDAAMTMYRETGMRAWMARAETEMRESNEA